MRVLPVCGGRTVATAVVLLLSMRAMESWSFVFALSLSPNQPRAGVSLSAASGAPRDKGSSSRSSSSNNNNNNDKNSGCSIVERCYAAWNRRDMKAAAACFAPSFLYDDGLFLGSLRKDRALLERRFGASAELLPPGSVVVVDHLAVCPTTGNTGTEWHAEDPSGRALPRTRGCSFYTMDPETGLIASGFKHHLRKNAEALPPSCQIVLDGVANDPARGTAGVRGHLEANGIALPNLRGCSMYTTTPANVGVGVGVGVVANETQSPGTNTTEDPPPLLLKTGFDVTEAPVKIPGAAQDLLASVVPPDLLFGLFR
ncbi:unnamed protein product [Pseudo-nitzschia multistriata]|uniref:SnoaL-like domain-containing protein n=1 Tax=Pseudo-nitzschia multistriata TaxID=183589 RepID=A0A448ZC09_9STRA|nr:unnamed protein product [Pseudo-nitzschia multistriata]